MGEEAIKRMLQGGHPNSLGRTIEVVSLVLEDRSRMDELFQCYTSPDAVVRMRTSNALKRIEKERHEWLLPYLDRLIDEIGGLDQPSAQWSLAQLFDRLVGDMDETQRRRAMRIMQRNLEGHDDWIVLNRTVQTLSLWAGSDAALRRWLEPHLQRLSADRRKSVAKTAGKALTRLHGRAATSTPGA